ncbi:GspH/FimT family pseudopilin [Marinobacter lipolyticus]|uniref:GspH/FimT family pseudopilin n=1 Tax=Marinobacter lipolyticus TaxID=209639 RepID=UPI003A8CA5C8
MKRNMLTRGFTLVELLFTLAIVAVITGLAAPAMDNLIQTNRRHTAVSDLITMINLARNTAIMEQQTITLCPLDKDRQCATDWTGIITVFRDPESDKTLDHDNQIIRISQVPEGGYWTANTSSRPYFRFMPTGIANYAIGNMIWCPDNKDPARAAQLIINRGGRIRLSKDTNGDGIVENASGTPITCT